MFSFTWNIPPKFEKLISSGYCTWVVLEFIEMNDCTMIRLFLLSNLGYPDNDEWNEVYDYCNEDCDYVLDSLVKISLEE